MSGEVARLVCNARAQIEWIWCGWGAGGFFEIGGPAFFELIKSRMCPPLSKSLNVLRRNLRCLEPRKSTTLLSKPQRTTAATPLKYGSMHECTHDVMVRPRAATSQDDYLLHAPRRWYATTHRCDPSPKHPGAIGTIPSHHARRTLPPRSITTALRTCARARHREADSLVRLTAPLALSSPLIHRRAVASFFHVYLALEAALDARAATDARAAAVRFPEAFRAGALRADLRHYYGEDYARAIAARDMSPATREYVRAAEEEPLRLVALSHVGFFVWREMRGMLRGAFDFLSAVG